MKVMKKLCLGLGGVVFTLAFYFGVTLGGVVVLLTAFDELMWRLFGW